MIKSRVSTFAFVCLVGVVLAIPGLAYADPVAAGPNGNMVTGNVVDGLQVYVSSVASTFRVGDRIELDSELKNLSDAPIDIGSADNGEIFKIEVILPNRELAPLTLFGRANYDVARTSVFRSIVVATVEPGQSIGRVLHLNRTFDMTLSGDYEVNVTVEQPNKTGGATKSVWKAGPLKLKLW